MCSITIHLWISKTDFRRKFRGARNWIYSTNLLTEGSRFLRLRLNHLGNIKNGCPQTTQKIHLVCIIQVGCANIPDFLWIYGAAVFPDELNFLFVNFHDFFTHTIFLRAVGIDPAGGCPHVDDTYKSYPNLGFSWRHMRPRNGGTLHQPPVSHSPFSFFLFFIISSFSPRVCEGTIVSVS